MSLVSANLHSEIFSEGNIVDNMRCKDFTCTQQITVLRNSVRLSRNISRFMVPEESLPCSQKPANRLCTEPVDNLVQPFPYYLSKTL